MMKRSFSELLRIRKDEELALRGAGVLERMENALNKELLALEATIAALQEENHSLMLSIWADLGKARQDSPLVDISAMVSSEPIDNRVSSAYKKKFGKLVSVLQPFTPHEAGPAWGAAFSYERARSDSKRLLSRLVELGNAQAERDFTSSELAKTRRRVNALRKIILPDLASDKKKLEEWIEEETREELGRRQWMEGLMK
jgi:V/A-type H+-transporting ATPase subunit D